MKWLARILLVLVVFVAIVFAGAAAYLSTLDPNEYKQQLADLVREETGRTLTVEGNISLSYFPWLGFSAENVSLSSQPGFPTREFVRADYVEVSVRLIPLLFREVELAEVQLRRFKGRFEKLASGQANWDFSPPGDTADAPARAPASGDDQSPLRLLLGGLNIQDAAIEYLDHGNRQSVRVADLNMQIGEFAPGATFPFQVRAAINSIDPVAELQLEASGRAAVSQNLKDVTVTDTKVKLSARTPQLPDENVVFEGRVNANTAREFAGIQDMNIQAAGLTVTGSLDVEGFADPRLTSTFSIRGNELNLDKLSAAKPSGNQASARPAAEGAGAPQPLPIPVDFLRKLTAQGDVAIQRLIVSNMQIDNLNAKLSANKGDVRLDPVTANLYKGPVEARVRLNVAGEIPQIQLATQGQSISLAGLIRDMTGEEYVDAGMSANIDLTMAGRTDKELVRTLNGQAAFNVEEGVIQKWQLSQRINQAIAFFETGRLPDSTADNIRFTSMRATADIRNGVISNNDLLLIAPKSHAKGAGQVNLVNETVNYTVQVGLSDNPAKIDKKTHLPIVISGPLQSPSYRLDVAGLARAKAQEELNRQTDKLKDRLQDKLNEKLGNPGDQSQENTLPNQLLKKLPFGF